MGSWCESLSSKVSACASDLASVLALVGVDCSVSAATGADFPAFSSREGRVVCMSRPDSCGRRMRARSGMIERILWLYGGEMSNTSRLALYGIKWGKIGDPLWRNIISRLSECSSTRRSLSIHYPLPYSSHSVVIEKGSDRCSHPEPR